MIAALANGLWTAGQLRRWQRFRAALGDPGRFQGRLLKDYLAANAGSEFGRRHRFAEIDSLGAYRRRVPLSTWDDYAPAVERLRRGETRILTRRRVRRLVPSSGSTAARKLVPWTRLLQAEFNRAIGPWVVDLYRRHPRLLGGRTYWSVSPALAATEAEGSAIPIGFDEDTSYLGGFFRFLVERTLAVPGAVRRLADLESFHYATLLHLLHARELALISVWHPSFLTLLLDSLARHWDRLLDDLAAGTLSPPRSVGGKLECQLVSSLAADPGRAADLRRLGPERPAAIWPRLGVISCWTDAHAAAPAAGLSERFPGVEIEPKGLIATEALVSFPFAGRRPMAVASHFFELLDDRGRPHLVDELRAGGEYSVVVSTGGGLYRYRLGDRVRVEGFLGRTPCLRFLGRDDRVSDRCGEKLSEGHVSKALERLLAPLGPDLAFAMLAPDENGGRTGYTLYMESRRPPPAGLAGRLEQLLEENPHYRYCAALGQLLPVRIFRVRGAAHHVYLEHRRRRGQRLGDVKPAALSPESGWSARFAGDYSSE